MTGYGLGKSQSTESQIEVSIRTVNGRYFEPRFHIPREYHQFESELKKILAEHFERGTIDIYISRKIKAESLNHSVQVNVGLAKQYLTAYKNLASKLKLKSQLQVESLARLPEVVTLEEETELTTGEKKVLVMAFKKACQSALDERKREGKSLKEDMEKILKELENEVSLMTEVREEANSALEKKFETKFKGKLGTNNDVDQGRIYQEIVIQLEKSDINEELMRLKEHIKNYRHILSLSEALGKKLDFYTQELLREVNTIGSKSGVSKLTQTVVQAKTLIERLREQVQNIE